MKRYLLLALLLLLVSAHARAQTVGNLRLPRDYRGQLDRIVDKMGDDMKIRFVFDRDHLARYNTSLTTYEEKTVGGVLKMLADTWDMATRIGTDGYIYIARDQQALAALMNTRTEQTFEVSAEKQAVRRELEPVKRNFVLTGSVADIANGERMPYATVSVLGTTNGVTTDANGRFTLQRVPSDTVVIEVSYIGYQKKFVELAPSPQNDPLHIDLEPQKNEIAEVFVYGRKDDKALEQYVDEQKIKMAPAALKFLPNIGEKDIMRSFQLMPGVSASNENSSGMYVRGGPPDQNLILYDGFTVYYVDHLHGFYSAFNSNALKDVQLYKGGFESKFGGRLSSVTEITGKDGNAKKWTLGGEVSLLSVNLFAEVPIGDKFTSLFAFRRSYQGYLYDKISGQNKEQSDDQVVSRPDGRGFGGQSDTKSYFYDMNAKITWNATPRDIYSLSFFNGTDYVDNTPTFSFPGGGMGGGMGGGGGFGGFGSMAMDNSDYSRYGNVGTSLRWSRKWNDRLTSTTLASFSNFYSKRDESRSVTYTRDDVEQNIKSGVLEDNDLKDFTLSNTWKHSLSDRHILEYGAFGTWYDIHYSYAQSDTATLVAKTDNAVMAGVFLQDKMRLAGGKWTVTPGVRATWFSNTGKFYFEPRLSSSYAFSPTVSLNAATGLYHQFANRVVREDIMSGNTDFWILSNNDDIPVSRSAHFNLGLNYNLPDYLFSVEGYYKRNFDISEYTLRFQRKPGQGGPGGRGGGAVESNEQFYTGDGYATGVEFLAQKKAGKFSGWVSYTIGQVKNRFPDQSSKYFYAYQDVTHEFKTVAVYKFGNFDFSATWIYSTGRPYTAPLGGYTLTLVDGTSESYYAVSDKNTFRLPDYHRLDLAASFRFDMFGTRGRPNALSFSLFNAYNRRNVSAKKFQIVDGAILESNINYLSITPNVTLSVKF